VRLVGSANWLPGRLENHGLRCDGLVGRVGAADDLRHIGHGRIRGEAVLPYECVEAALRTAMAELNILYVIWRRALFSRFGHHLIGRHVDELRVLVDELLNKPRAGYAVDAGGARE